MSASAEQDPGDLRLTSSLEVEGNASQGIGSSSRGTLMLTEIKDQPAALRRLLGHTADLRAVADRLTEARPPVVRLVGHGSSDNAATYGVYAFGLLCGWTALRESISLTVYYDAPLELRGSVVLALSQSGQTPDVIAYAERARARGALTIALTNDPGSQLAQTAEIVVPLWAESEKAVAATKTYMNSLATLALLAGYAGGCGAQLADRLRATADVIQEAIADLEPTISRMVADFVFIGRMFVIGRGLELATAREIGLKLQETCRVAADALSATDLAHGPVNAVDPFFPVWTIATLEEANLPAVLEAAHRAHEAGATLLATGTAVQRIEGATYRLETPPAPDRVLSPLVSVLPGQLFARALSLAKGYDPDCPANLTKITRVP
jgi:glucosamine--fructose-6-phosphate aminotransferase (isomerizing)